MLTQAKQISLQKKQNVNYFVADLTKLEKYGSFDFITIINDGINYVSQDKLEKTFKGLYKNLKKGGVLLFDISSKYKLEKVLANNLFGEDYEEFSYLWFNKLYQDKIEMDLSFFIKKGEYYVKQEEKHTQYIHSVENVLKIASNVGFEILEADQEADKQRLYFIFRRK